MFYGEVLAELLTTERNPVNKMYLNEIRIKWKNLEKAAADKEQSNELLVKALNSFTKQINNRKYRFVESSEKGFKDDSPLFKPLYLDDIISIFMNRRSILQHLGIKWGRQRFTTNQGLNPISICSMQDEPNFVTGESPEFLMLTQEFDFQFRITGKRRFIKQQLLFPLMIFHTYRVLKLEDVIRAEYYANMAKSTFAKVHVILVTEMVEESLMHDIKTLPFDTVFVLRKQVESETLEPISLEVVNALEEKITSLLVEKDEVSDNFKETGIISQ